MKNWKRIALLLLALLLLTGCASPERRISGSEYSEGSIRRAMSVVEKQFRRNFEGCTLLSVTYDEAATGEKAAREAERWGKDTIILLTDFTVANSGGASGLTPGMTYRHYEWTLVRTFFGWKLKDWGYA